MPEKELNLSSGSTEKVPAGTTTLKEAEQASEMSQMRALMLQMQNQISKLTEAADTNKLEAISRRDGERVEYLEVTVPSLDGIDPIIDIQSEGTAYLDAFDNVVDTQTRTYKTLAGKTGKLGYQVFMQLVLAHPMNARSNNLDVTFDVEGFRRLRPVKPDFQVNVTLWDDERKDFSGATFEIKYKHLNWSKASKEVNV